MSSVSAATAQPVLTGSVVRDWAWRVALTGLCTVLLVPLLVVDVPPLLDYPNHLARVFVLASLPHDPVLAGFYAPHWSIIPNLALDLIALPLPHVLPVHVVGRPGSWIRTSPGRPPKRMRAWAWRAPSRCR